MQISRETHVSEYFICLRKLFAKTVVLHPSNFVRHSQTIVSVFELLFEFFWKIPTHRHHFFRSAVDQSKKIGTVCIEHKPTRFLQAIYFISLTGWRNFTRKVYIVFGTDFSLQQIHRLSSYQDEFFLRNLCFLTKTMYREKNS